MRTRNVEIVQTMLALGGTGNLDALKEYIADDYVVIEAESLPYGGEFRGFAGYVQIMMALADTWQDPTWDVHQLIADDNTVAVRLTLKGRRGDQHFVMPVVELWDFRDGKLVASTPYYFDTKLMADLYQRAR